MKRVVLSLVLLVVAACFAADVSAADRRQGRNFQPQARAACNNNAFGTRGSGLQYQYYSPSYGYGNYNSYYGGYGNGFVNYGYPGALFVSPAAFGYGPGAIFGW